MVDLEALLTQPGPRLAFMDRKTSIPRVWPLGIFSSWNGGRGRIRTHDLLIRSQSLYPTELRALTALVMTTKCVL